MCCFSKPVKLVANTNIFARAAAEGAQFLVYSMKLGAAEDVAMILPIPVPPRSKEEAVRFINLEKYDNFFDHLNDGFPVPPEIKATGRAGALGSAPALKVVEVGSFIASFVPSIEDFARLDEQFRLSTDVWDMLPQYKDWGFAVFQLKKGEKKIHPMAFEFPRRDPKKLFFPTVHIHDGSVPARAKFDHFLYCQVGAGSRLREWDESKKTAETFMRKLDEAKGIIDAKGHVYRKRMNGVFANRDVVV